MVDQPLKRLSFVQTGTSLAWSEGEKAYKRVRAYAPQFVTPSLQRAEDAVFEWAPLLTRAQDIGDKLLHLADDEVDYAVHLADKTLCQGKSAVKHLHDTNMKTFNAARDVYLAFISKTAEYVLDKVKVNGVQPAHDTLHAAHATLQAALLKAREATDPDVAVDMAYDAWSTFAALPPVAKLLDTAEPATKLGLHTFSRLHDAVVATPLYKSVLDSTAGTMQYTASTTPYRLGAQYLYPLVQPMADPAISKVSHSKVLSMVIDYWKPAPAVAAH